MYRASGTTKLSSFIFSATTYLSYSSNTNISLKSYEGKITQKEQRSIRYTENSTKSKPEMEKCMSNRPALFVEKTKLVSF